MKLTVTAEREYVLAPGVGQVELAAEDWMTPGTAQVKVTRTEYRPGEDGTLWEIRLRLTSLGGGRWRSWVETNPYGRGWKIPLEHAWMVHEVIADLERRLA